jgi:ABC-type transport system involved in multi-copper enzyme maturation permease subunit
MTALAIARNTFRECIRDKILYNLVLFALLMIVSSYALGQLSLGHENKVIVDVGLSAISIIGTLIAVFIGIGLVYKELEKRTVYALLSKPVRRGEFLFGKYLGLLLTLFVNVAVMSAGLLATLLLRGGVSWQECLSILPASYVMFLSLALTTSVALVFSTFSTPALSALFTLFLWIIGHYNSDLLSFAQMNAWGPVRGILRALYYLLPNLSNFTWVDSRSIIHSAGYYRPIDAVAIAWMTLYAVLYSGCLLALATWVFARRDFK